VSGEKKRSVGTFFGGLVMVVGVLILTLSGLCTAGFLVMLVGDELKRPGSSGMGGMGEAILIPLLFGALPIIVGLGLFIFGRGLRRSG
jgi:hypothetical protein